MPRKKNQLAKAQTECGKYEVLLLEDSTYKEYIQIRKNRVKIANYQNTGENRLRAIKRMLNEAEYDLLGQLNFD